MNIKELVVEFVTVFAVALVTTALVTFLWNLIGYGESTIDWETSFRFAIIFGIILTWVKSQKTAAVADELVEVKADYSDRRRTQIVSVAKGKTTKPLTARDLLPEQTVWVGVTADGLASRTRDHKKAPRPSGNKAPRWLAKASTTDTLYLVSESGKTAAVAVHTLPQADRTW